MIELLTEASDRMQAGGDCAALFLDLQRPFASFAAGGAWRDSLASTLSVIASKSFADSAAWNESRLVLFSSEQIQLSLGIHEVHAKHIYSLTSHAMIANVGATELPYTLYQVQAPWNPEVLDKSVELLRDRDGVLLNQGNPLVLLADGRCVDFAPTGPSVVLKLVSRPTQTLEWAFDRDTRLAWGVMAASFKASQITCIAEALASLNDEQSVQGLRGLTRHPAHFVRWKALQCLARIDGGLALSELEIARHDSHPHVRQSALVALQKHAANR